MTEIDARIAALARKQYGVFAGRQLSDVSGRAIRARTRDGTLRRLHRDVYAIGPFVSVRGQWLAAVLGCGPRALLSHRAAGALWELTEWRGGPVDVTLAGTGSSPRRGIRLHRATTLIAADHTVHERIPVTSPSRTLLDLAATLDEIKLRRAYEQAERAGKLDTVAIVDLLTRSNGHQGAAKLRALLEYDPAAGAAAASWLEHRFLDLLTENQVPHPITNTTVDGHIVDCFWPAANLVVELDSYEFHHDPEAFERDRRKLAELRLAGREAIPITYRQVTREPGWVVETSAR